MKGTNPSDFLIARSFKCSKGYDRKIQPMQEKTATPNSVCPTEITSRQYSASSFLQFGRHSI